MIGQLQKNKIVSERFQTCRATVGEGLQMVIEERLLFLDWKDE